MDGPQTLDHSRFGGRKVLVTGGAGFIGTNLVQRLLCEQATVTVLDDASTGCLEGLPGAEGRLDVVRGSVTDEGLVRQLVARAQIVFHLAARNIIVSTRDPREDYAVNIGGTLNVLLAAREAGLQRVVYASSASIYGNPRYLPINEDDVHNALSPYSVSKYTGESYCRAFYESYGVSSAIVRYSNVYGTGQCSDNAYCGVVARFFEAAMAGADVLVHGDGEQTRDFTFVDDAVEATLLAAVSPKAEGQVYNVGTGLETSINGLAAAIIAAVGSPSAVKRVDRRDIDNIRRRVVNIEKIRTQLRWVPAVTMKEGLERTYRWLRQRAGGTPKVLG